MMEVHPDSRPRVVMRPCRAALPARIIACGYRAALASWPHLQVADFPRLPAARIADHEPERDWARPTAGDVGVVGAVLIGGLALVEARLLVFEVAARGVPGHRDALAPWLDVLVLAVVPD